MYPVYLVLAGYTITVRGSGFTADGNSVRIGAAVLENLSSPDGKIIKFRAPEPPEKSFLPGRRIYQVSVFNANGESNSISLEYR